jgi:lauroyl/myristoyl acyltransferase
VTLGDTPSGRPRRQSGAAGGSRERRLEAPHRRGGSSPRVVERLALVAYRAIERLLTVLPQGPTALVVGLGAQLSYLAWPTKRRWSNRNFGHVLGLSPDDPRVRSLALRAYRAYGRYLVEFMRLPSLPRSELARLVPAVDVDGVRQIWRATDGNGLILVVAHMGSNEAVGASMAGEGMPISVVADDSAFPELFDHLRRQREAWGFHLIPWRNLREIFGVLRRGEILGLLVDWGYRADGIPVRLFDAWTALPAGPATLAGKTGARILPITIRRLSDGTYHVSWPDPIDVVSTDPAELQRATQAIADALAANIGGAPDQWYSFKPIWPGDPAEVADLERRARLMQAGRADPGPGAGARTVTEPASATVA